MNQKLPLISLLLPGLMLVFLSSCKTYEFFSIDVLEPATVDFSSDIKKVLVAHNFSPFNRDSTGTMYQVYNQVVYDTLYIDTLLGRYAINSLSDKLNHVGRFEAVPVDSTGRVFPNRHELFTTQDVNHIRQLCEKYQADGMILLNSTEKQVNYDLYYNSYEGYFGQFLVYLNTHWLFINPYISKLLDENTMVDTIAFQSPVMLFEYDFESEDTRHEYMIGAYEEATAKYAERVSPHYSSTDRIVFTRGNKYLKKGYEQALTGNWKEASFIWDKSLNGREPKNLAKACFNLALSSEMEGLLDEALLWAQESHRLFPDIINQTYILILQERLEQQKKILMQMEGTR